MKPDSDSEILSQYEEKLGLYEAFAACIEDLLYRITKDKGIEIHTVTSRTKNPRSLREKISRPGKSYNHLEDITDLAGIRVITYFPDQIDDVLKTIRGEFDVDDTRSVDKRVSKAPDVFGYASVHVICSLNTERSSLTEYRRFRGLVCEIQVRSILQHTWAQIEHDLGYKNTVGVPDSLRRRFAKLAALLELADDEFMHLRDDLEAYTEKVRGAFKKEPASVGIDSISLRLFIDNDPFLRELELKKIAEAVGGGLFERASERMVAMRVDEVRHFRIESIEALRNAILQNADKIVEYAKVAFENDEEPIILFRGFAIFALSLILAGGLPTEDDTSAALLELGVHDPLLSDIVGAVRAIARGKTS